MEELGQRYIKRVIENRINSLASKLLPEILSETKAKTQKFVQYRFEKHKFQKFKSLV